MLRKASTLIGASIAAKDGEIGSVTDLLFGDENWSVRWMVVDPGTWLSARNVLLPSSHLKRVLPAARGILVDLTRDQVKSSPDVGTDLPVSRQMEASIFDHYGSAPYWPAGASVDAPMEGYPGYLPPGHVVPPPARAATPDDRRRQPSGDPRLRSANEVTGHYVQGSDGEIGHVEDFLVDAEGWAIRYIIVDPKSWWPGKHVLIAPSWVEGIDWGGRTVRMSRSRGEIRNAPEYDPTQTIERDYESKLHRYYGRSEYWQ